MTIEYIFRKATLQSLVLKSVQARVFLENKFRWG